MAKRKKKSAPNIPDAALARARKQIGADETTSNDAEEVSKVVEAKEASPSRSAKRRRKVNIKSNAVRRSNGEMSGEMVAQLLANPTKEVSEDELRTDYNYVLQDLRSMGLLAGLLFLVLLALGFLQAFLV